MLAAYEPLVDAIREAVAERPMTTDLLAERLRAERPDLLDAVHADRRRRGRTVQSDERAVRGAVYGPEAERDTHFHRHAICRGAGVTLIVHLRGDDCSVARAMAAALAGRSR